ncbi:MAG: phosphatase PAP2 family protein [Kiritimatiellales bacterium]|nr:phosphatase PAP2 family protein [Kiritimatiellales bacterium]
MKKKSVLLIALSMMFAAVIFSSWVRTQESYRDEKGRPALCYTQKESLWKKMDYHFFLILNGTMKDSPLMQRIWGVGNHRSFDLVSASWMAMLFLIYYIRNPRHENRKELVQFGLYMTLTLLTVTAFAELIFEFRRLSPSATPDLTVRAILLSDLKEVVTWDPKVFSSSSFPGDHAMVLMFIGSFIIWRLRSWYGWAAAFGMIVFALPRLAGGGHWLSDILVGSLSFYLFFFPLFMFPPLREKMLELLDKPAGWIYKPLSFLERR